MKKLFWNHTVVVGTCNLFEGGFACVPIYGHLRYLPRIINYCVIYNNRRDHDVTERKLGKPSES